MRQGLTSLLCGTVLVAMTAVPLASAEESIWLDSLDLSLMRQATGEPKANQSVSGMPLSMGGRTFPHGIGTHASSQFFIALNGTASRFTATVGVDDCAADAAGIVFKVYGDRKLLFESEQLYAGGEPVAIDLDVSGLRMLALFVDDCGDAEHEDKGDWADAQIRYKGEKPVAVVCPSAAPAGLLTPAPAAEPRINGPRVFGVRPGTPFLFTVPATGDRPMTFAAEGLPEGLALDPASGRITGQLAAPGEHKVILQAQSDKGTARRELRIVCGKQIALTPPMGWTSRFKGAASLSQQLIKDAADALVATGLSQHGWSYVCIDDGWQGTRQPPQYALQPNERFPDLSGLCTHVHEQGLKIGIYSTPWRTTFQGCTGGSADDEQGGFIARGQSHGKVAYCAQDARQFAAWGIDLLKYEWRPMDIDSTKAISLALRDVPRDVVLSVANGAPIEQAAAFAEWAHCVQTTGEPPDRWSSVRAAATTQSAWRTFTAPGHWHGMDILLTALQGPPLHPASGLTENEQYAQMSLWCLNAAPLFFSIDPTLLKKADDPRTRFALGLLSNDEVLAVNQDETGQQAQLVRADEETEVWVKELADGSKAVGLFNRSSLGSVPVEATWEELGLQGKQAVRDLWRQKDLGTFEARVSMEVDSHGVLLLRFRGGASGE